MANITIMWATVPRLTPTAELLGEDITGPHAVHVGDILSIIPGSTYELTDADLNGRVGPPDEQRQKAWARITDVPDINIDRIKIKLQEQTQLVTLAKADVLDNLSTDEAYILRTVHVPELTIERQARFQLVQSALITELPGATALINLLFNPDVRHPSVPSVAFNNLKGCFFDKYTGQMASGAEIEG